MRAPVLALALMALCAAGPAAADDAATLETCMDGADDAETCVGTISGPCQTASPDTTLAITECLRRETAAWDVLLNRYWKPLRDEAKAGGSWDSLLAAQRAWIAFRDAECAHAYEEFAGGSIRTIMGADCQMRMTADRAIEFRDRLGEAR